MPRECPLSLLDGSPKSIIIAARLLVHGRKVLPSLSATPRIRHVMKLRILSGLSVLVCLSLASCYPYDESQGKKKNGKTTEKVKTPEELAKEKEAAAKKKAEEDLKKKEAELKNPTTDPGNTAGVTPDGTTGGTTPPGPKPTDPPKKSDYPFAQKVPGKEGFVFSPYNSKVVDAHDEQGRPIPSGTLVADPTYPESEKKYFRVP